MTELRQELRKAKEAVQLIKEAAEAEKHVAYTLRMEETQARLTEEFSAVCRDYYSSAVCRDYYDISWGKTLDVARVLANSSLRQPESI